MTKDEITQLKLELQAAEKTLDEQNPKIDAPGYLNAYEYPLQK